MNWLIWKDFRLNRPILVTFLFLLIAPHATALIAGWYNFGSLAGLLDHMSKLLKMLVFTGIYSLMIAQIAMAFLGGNAIACERESRSAEFLAYLPIPRSRVLVSKLIVVLATVAVMWIPNLLVLYGCAYQVSGSEIPLEPHFGELLGGAAVVGAVFFSVAWTLSAFLTSPAFSALGGFVVFGVVALGVLGVAWMFDLPPEVFFWPWTCRICLGIAPVCFVAGTWYYLRRVEP